MNNQAIITFVGEMFQASRSKTSHPAVLFDAALSRLSKQDREIVLRHPMVMDFKNSI